MLRRLYKISFSLSLILCVATCVFWISALISPPRDYVTTALYRTSPLELLRTESGVSWNKRTIDIPRLNFSTKSRNRKRLRGPRGERRFRIAESL
jgi:hypothetical protein